ncbi:uncharacterized protein BJ212DRAFT_1387877, partial [Suillus subaureus]
ALYIVCFILCCYSFRSFHQCLSINARHNQFLCSVYSADYIPIFSRRIIMEETRLPYPEIVVSIKWYHFVPRADYSEGSAGRNQYHKFVPGTSHDGHLELHRQSKMLRTRAYWCE